MNDDLPTNALQPGDIDSSTPSADSDSGEQSAPVSSSAESGTATDVDVVTTSPPPPLTIAIDVEYDRRVNFAMQQNDVPIVKLLRLRNEGDTDTADLDVTVRLDRQLSSPWRRRVARIEPGATYNLEDVTLALNAEVLLRQTEREAAQLHVEVRCDDALIGQHSEPIEVLASNEWGGIDSLPEIMAAFVLPNHPAIDGLLSRASQHLGERTGSPSLNGYQSRDPQRVRATVSAIYQAVRECDIAYVSPPASFEHAGQKVRLPDAMIDAKLGTCFDLALLLAACIEQAGLHPLILLTQGHAFTGAWLIDDAFPEPTIDDVTRINKRIHLDEMMVIEATAATAGAPLAIADAEKAAMRHLRDRDDFLCAVDIRCARKLRIRPLPYRIAAGEYEVVESGGIDQPGLGVSDPPPLREGLGEGDAPHVSIHASENASDLRQSTINNQQSSIDRTSESVTENDDPTASPSPGRVAPDGASRPPSPSEGEDADTAAHSKTEPPEPPAARLERWKRKLLDLTLRNRLINHRETKKAIPLLCPDLPALEDALADGKAFSVHDRPKLMDDAGPRSAEAHRQRTGEDAVEGFLLDELRAHRLYTELTETELDRRLLEIYRAARSSMEETGANTLYLAVGFLCWYESNAANAPQRRAPILLLPLRMERQSVREGFRIYMSEEDARINVTLLEKLKAELGLDVTGLDELPEDESGLDIRAIFKRFRKAVRDVERWDVSDEACIGLFSFSKFLMWLDLQERSDQLMRNDVVRYLIERPNEPFDPGVEYPDASNLDRTRHPSQLFCPLDADSSQLAAVVAGHEGRSFVLEGPPGTGKSQTITNLIAQCLGHGKRVLFVSEKMAALNVVRRRLQNIGLGPFCLELHSNKTNKKDVLNQLEEALSVAGETEPGGWQQASDELHETRTHLNDYVQTIHEQRRIGRSVFQVTSNLIGLRDVPTVTLDEAWVDAADEAKLREARERIDQLVTAATNVGDLSTHPYRAVQREQWHATLPDEVATSVDASVAAIDAYRQALYIALSELRLPMDGGAASEARTASAPSDPPPLREGLGEGEKPGSQSSGATGSLPASASTPNSDSTINEPASAPALADKPPVAPGASDLQQSTIANHQSSIDSNASESESTTKAPSAAPSPGRDAPIGASRPPSPSEGEGSQSPPPTNLDPHDRLSAHGLAFLADLAQLLTEDARATEALLTDPAWPDLRATLLDTIEHGRQRDQMRGELLGRYRESLLEQPLEQLLTRLRKGMTGFVLVAWFTRWRVRSAIKPFATQKLPFNEKLAGDLELAIKLRDEDRALKDGNHPAARCFGAAWQGGEAEWNKLEAMIAWVDRFRALVVTAGARDFAPADALRNRCLALAVAEREQCAAGAPTGDALRDLLAKKQQHDDALQSLVKLLDVDESRAWPAPTEPAHLRTVRKTITAWKDHRRQLADFCHYRRTRRAVLDAGLPQLVDALEAGRAQPADLHDVFTRSFQRQWLNRVTDAHDQLRDFTSAEHERRIARFRRLDTGHLSLASQTLRARLAANVPRVFGEASAASEMGILQRQTKLQRRHMPVRKLIARLPNLLPRLKPCLLMSPLSVAQYLDADYPAFDIIVFDEASQIPVWDAVGAIARGTHVIVVGDSKQLPPTNFFMKVEGEEEIPDEDDFEELESILDECSTAGLRSLRLRWHYRSRHESLITFSNYHYYNNELHTFPSPLDRGEKVGVSTRFIADGVYDKGKSRTNQKEAQAVVAEIVRRLTSSDEAERNMSIGVVTFSIAQQSLIEDLLDQARREHPEMESYFGDGVLESVFVKNLENVQGDERDVILFSVCYGPDQKGRVAMNFGPLNREGGQRRLNVAITRARQQVIVFTSLRADQIDLARTRAVGVRDMRTFLDYADRGPDAIAEAITLDTDADFDSPFEKDVYDALRDCGWEADIQVGCSGYRIDLAVRDPQQPGRYLLGVECDGAFYHSAATARDRDRIRQAVLEGLGWKLHRIWSTDWYRDPERELAELDEAIRAAMRNEHVGIPIETPDAPPTADGDFASDLFDSDKSQPSTIPGLLPYKTIEPDTPLGSADEFYEPKSRRRVRDTLLRVIKHEGPIAFELAVRRVIAFWQFSKITDRARTHVEEIVAMIPDDKRPRLIDGWFWPADVEPETYEHFRAPLDESVSPRDVEQIHPREIANAAAVVLQQQIALPRADLLRETAKLLGFSRMTNRVEPCMDAGVELLKEQGRCVIGEDGNVTLTG